MPSSYGSQLATHVPVTVAKEVVELPRMRVSWLDHKPAGLE